METTTLTSDERDTAAVWDFIEAFPSSSGRGSIDSSAHELRPIGLPARLHGEVLLSRRS